MVKCLAVGCKAGYESSKKSNNLSVPEKKVTFYYVPKDTKSIKLWQKAIWRDDIKVKAGHAVCQKHFKESDFIHEKLIFGKDGTVIGKTILKKPQLKEGALPTLHLGRATVEKERRLPLKRNLSAEVNSEIQNYKKRKIDAELNELDIEKTKELSVMPDDEKDLQDGPSNSDLISSPIQNNETNNLPLENTIESSANETTLFQEISENEIRMPPSWIRSNISWGNEHGVTFVKLIGLKGKNGFLDSTVHKKLTIDENLLINISINGRLVNKTDLGISFEKIETLENLQEILETLEKSEICFGNTSINMNEQNSSLLRTFCYVDGSETLRNNHCPILLSTQTKSNNRQCNFCKNINQVLNKKIVRSKHNKRNYIQLSKISPIKREKIKKLCQNKRNSGRSKEKAKEKIRSLKLTLLHCQKRISELSETSVTEILAKNPNISENEHTVIKEIFKSAKCKSLNGRRYSDEWLLLCILLHMKSPATYRLLLENKILPVPSVRTIRRYLEEMDCPCGFDSKFLEVLKVHFEKKSPIELHGLILLDEISTRKNLLLDNKTMMFKGVEDFGGDIPKNDNLIMADHGLVIMFQPLYDTYSQPIAVFASNGPTSGDVLAKLIVQALIFLEKAGAKVHGIVSDGGRPNRKLWTEMGCSGKLDGTFKNFFQHPVEEGRKVFFFSDTPHLMKTIRNRFASSEMLEVYPDCPILWKHIKIMHDLDKILPAAQRLCPKITDSHIDVMSNNKNKMRVSLAVQVFSKSVARGLRFYKQVEKELEHSEPTSEFCEFMNDMFDALNRTKEETGLRLGCNDIQVLKDSLDWLNSWNKRVKDNLIKPKSFLTEETAVGLRMTLHSTIDLVNHLLSELKMDVVLTGRINQDPLERFFGSIRLAGGCNDHPATPTFLQIYKILSYYCILTPPKTGNCSLPDVSNIKPLMTMTKLREIFKSNNKKSLIEDIKKKLNLVVEEKDNDFSDFIKVRDHDYDNPYVIQCLMYFVTGNICKNFRKFTKCEVCHTGLIQSKENSFFSNNPIAQLVTREEDKIDIQHPNTQLYLFLQRIEESFARHVKKNNSYDAVIDEISQEEIKFPCSTHAEEVVSYIVFYYIQFRMRQYAKIQIADQKKKSSELRKISKFYST